MVTIWAGIVRWEIVRCWLLPSYDIWWQLGVRFLPLHGKSFPAPPQMGHERFLVVDHKR